MLPHVGETKLVSHESDVLVETLGDLSAHRAAYRFVLDALQVVLSMQSAEVSSSVGSALELMLEQKRDEHPDAAPGELSPDLQAIWNKSFREAFSMLCDEIVVRVQKPPGA